MNFNASIEHCDHIWNLKRTWDDRDLLRDPPPNGTEMQIQCKLRMCGNQWTNVKPWTKPIFLNHQAQAHSVRKVTAHNYTIVGVAEQGFDGVELGYTTQLFIPVMMRSRYLGSMWSI